MTLAEVKILSNHQKSISRGQKSILEGSKTAKILVRSDPETSEIDKSDSRGSKIFKILFSDRQRRSWPDRPEVNRAPGPRRERSGGRGPGVRNRWISCEGLDQKFSWKVSNVRRSDSQSGLRIEKRLAAMPPNDRVIHAGGFWGNFPATSSIIVPRPQGRVETKSMTRPGSMCRGLAISQTALGLLGPQIPNTWQNGVMLSEIWFWGMVRVSTVGFVCPTSDSHPA